MKTKAPFAIRFMNVIATISFAGTIIFTFVMLTIFLVTLLTGGDTYPLLNLFSKVSLGSFSPGILHYNAGEYYVHYYKINTFLEFSKYPKPYANYATLVLLLYLTAGIYLIWQFKKFVNNLKSGRFFIDENVMIFKRLGYGIITLWFVKYIYKLLFLKFIVSEISFENATILNDSYIPNTTGFYLGVAVLVMAHIFKYGSTLQRNEELTI